MKEIESCLAKQQLPPRSGVLEQMCIKNPWTIKLDTIFTLAENLFDGTLLDSCAGLVNSSFCYGVDELNIIKLKAEQKSFFPFIFHLFIRVDDGGWR
jgi:hypothetical protein